MIHLSPNTNVRQEGLIHHHRRAGDLVKRSIERLSTGKRINHPSDDPSGFIAAEQLRGDLFELTAEAKAAGYAKLGASQQESALAEIQRAVSEARGALVTAADGLNSPGQVEAVQHEIDATLGAVDLIAGRVGGVRNAANLGAIEQDVPLNVGKGEFAAAAEAVDGQLANLSLARAADAAYSKTSDAFDRIREDQIAITTETISMIEDADFAEEASNLATAQLLEKASAAAMVFSSREQAKQVEALLQEVEIEAAE